MTAPKLYATLKFLESLDSKLRLQTSLETIKDSLVALVNAPAQPPQQTALANAKATFESAAAKLKDSITPTQASMIAEMGGAEFFDAAIADKVKASIESNAMTPSVARDFVQDLVNKRSAFLTVVKSTAQGLGRLNVRESGLAPGAADLAFLIPRDLFENHLEAFAKELVFINRLIQDITEGVQVRPFLLKWKTYPLRFRRSV